jgi:hypothetical protein
MAVAVLWARDQGGDWLLLSLLDRFVALGLCVVGGMVVYFLTCYLVGLTPAKLRVSRLELPG